MAKKIKIWNGRGHGKYLNGCFYIAAYSVKQAVELVNKALGHSAITASEINAYYHKNSWGNSMDGIEPIEPAVYAQTAKNRWNNEKSLLELYECK